MNARNRYESAGWFAVTVLWRFGTGRPMTMGHDTRLTREQRAAYRWILLTIGFGLWLSPAMTIAIAAGACIGFTAGAMWVWRTDPDPAAPPVAKSPAEAPERVHLRSVPELPEIAPIWRLTRRDI